MTTHAILVLIFIVVSLACARMPNLRSSQAATTQQANSIQTIQFKYDSTKIATLLNRTLSTRYFTFHFSRNYTDIDTLKARLQMYDDIIEEAVQILQVSLPSFSIKCYIYANESEMRDCTGWPGGGFALLDEIHTVGLFPIEHEAVHVLVNKLVSPARTSFFAEGIRQYVEHVRYPDVFSRDLQITKKHLSEPIEKWANDSVAFHTTPMEGWILVAYPVSGLFARYLIHKHSLDLFKQFYKLIGTGDTKSIDVAFLAVYRKSLAEVVSEFKEHIAGQR